MNFRLLIFIIPMLPFAAGADILLPDPSTAQTEHEPVSLDFDAAAKKTLGHSTNLSIAENEIRARKGTLEQSRLYPNPTFTYSLETSEYGWDKRQDLYTLTQLIEWGIKRQTRINAASSEYYASLASYDLTKLERLNRLRKSFIKVAASQELLLLSVEEHRNAEEIFQMTHSKLQAGKTSLLEHHKTELTKKLAQLRIEQTAADLQNSKRNLQLILSVNHDDFDMVCYPLYEISLPPPLDEYLSRLCSQPEIIRSFYQHQAASANLKFEKSAVLPDLTVTLGYSYDQGDNGVVASVALPLPIWNQNQGNIKKARAEMHKITDQQNQLWLTLETKLTNAYTNLMRAFREAEEMKNHLMKIAEDTFHLSLEGYQEGKFDYVDVLLAKHTLFEIREKYIEVLVAYHTNLTELEFITSLTN